MQALDSICYAGMALRRLTDESQKQAVVKPTANQLFHWLACASEGLFLHASPVHVDLHHLKQPSNWAAALASLMEIRMLTSFNMSVLSVHHDSALERCDASHYRGVFK